MGKTKKLYMQGLGTNDSTHCTDQVSDDDVCFYHEDVVEALKARIEKFEEEEGKVEELSEALEVKEDELTIAYLSGAQDYKAENERLKARETQLHKDLNRADKNRDKARSKWQRYEKEIEALKARIEKFEEEEGIYSEVENEVLEK